MINFNSLKLVVEEKYSFVGIQKEYGTLRFCLPKGFSEHLSEADNFDDKRDLFFLFYRIFDKFKHICQEKGYLKNKTSDRDGVIKSSQGTTITVDGEDEENIFYSKLDIIGSILNAYDEAKILSLVYRLGKSEKVDHNQLHQFLHRAVFLPNGAAYVDFMDLPRQQVQFSSTDIVKMYCYLFDEIQQQLKQEVKPEIKALSEKFREHYIRADYSIFDEKYQSLVIDILKEALELIHRHTSLKDADYWDFYEAIELFLYGQIEQTEEGEIWGINNFHTVWESMCLTYLAKTIDPANLLFLDTQWISESVKKSVVNTQKLIDLSNAFKINNTEMRPDAVTCREIPFLLNLNQAKYKYILSANFSWNDWNYYTQFTFYDAIESKEIRRKINIGNKKNQRGYHTFCGNHTFYLLKNYYPLIDNKTLIIDKPLPDGFYSYFEVDIENLNFNEIYKMYYFKHIFYVSISDNCFSSDHFKTVFLELLTKSDVFRLSIFRYSIYNIPELEEIANYFTKKFIFFIQKVYKLKLLNFKVIDIKYLEKTDLFDSDNLEFIKNHSVRKQFVYEYLLKEHIQNHHKKFSYLNIESKFWIPGYNQEKLIKNDQKFMDGYIDLCSLDFEMLAEKYLS